MAIVVLVLVPRLLGLGTASMWFDEALQTLQTRDGLGKTWSALHIDVHPPLDALVSSLVQKLTSSESARRLVPVLWGVLTVALMSNWVFEVWGRRAAWAVGFLAALSPYHVRYSQELRPYSLAILLSLAAFLALDRLLTKWSWSRLFVAAAAVTGAFMTLFLNALLAIPFGVRWFSAFRSGRTGSEIAARALRAAPLLLLGPILFLLVWWPATAGLAERAVQEDINRWSLSAAWSRWEFLTIGGIEGEGGTGSSLVGLALVVLGAWAATKAGGRGLAVVAAALAGTFGVELLLLVGKHWTAGRYNFLAWPFVTVLLALGALRIAELASRIGRRTATSLLLGLLLIQGSLEARGLVRYYREGREDWRRVAAVLNALGADARPVLVANDWVQVLLGVYLESQPSGSFHLENLQGETRRLAEVPWSGRRLGRCASLVTGGWPSLRRLRKQVPNLTLVAEFPEAGASLFRIPPAPGAPDCPPLDIPPALRAYAKRPLIHWP